MGRASSIPVSCVGPEWFEKEFLEPIKAWLTDDLPKGGLIWLQVDAPDEGNYLIYRLPSLVHELNRHFVEICLEEADPFIFWDDFVGTMDHCGMICVLAPGTIIGVLNGCYLPNLFIQNRQFTLTGICCTHQLTLVIPIFHQEASILEPRLEANFCLTVPQFIETPLKERRILIHELLLDQAPDLEPVQCARLANQIIDAHPNSRTELQSWINHYGDASKLKKVAAGYLDPGALLWPPPELTRYVAFAPLASTRDKLEARFNATLVKLQEANQQFMVWLGRPLITRTQELLKPFWARDPMHWFCGTVSYLSCLLFDAADEALSMLSAYRVEEQASEIVASAPLPFLQRLRDLRSILQHKLSMDDQRQKDILERVQAWYYDCCQKTKPQRHHWRRLTEQLLDEWDEFVTMLVKCLRVIRQSPERKGIELQVAMHSRRLPRHQWYSLILKAIEECKVEVSPDQIIDKHYDRLRLRLQDSAVAHHAVLAEAQRIATEVVLEVSARCPLEASDFIRLGIQGPTLGMCLKKAIELWGERINVPKEELIQMVLDELKLRSPK